MTKGTIPMLILTISRNWLRLLAVVLIAASIGGAAEAQLDETCTVAVLNRTARVDEQGRWSIANVPTNAGLVRARATCVKDGVTRSGVSEYFRVPVDGTVFASAIRFEVPAPVPASLRLTAPGATVATGQQVQLSAIATNADGTQRNVTAASSGTTYTTSSAGLVSISPDGLATAHANGVVLVSALNEGALGLLRITVGGAADTDGDGIPDDFERAVGLNPNDPADALTDLDGDGLSNLREYQLGTDLRAADTDGDGVRDGLEVQLATDPLDRLSFDLARALRRVDVSPASVLMRTNAVFGETRQQLTVTGTMLDNATIDLTPSTRGTTYTSTDVNVAGFGDTDGAVFAANAGTCAVIVSTNSFSITVPVEVRTFEPGPAGVIELPGYANNVEVRGSYAYVAAGNAGLQVVDTRNPSAPSVAGALALPGTAIDVRLRDDLAFIAAGSAGLHIVRIAAPAAPVLVRTVDTPGFAQDVWLEGQYAYVADGSGGLQVVHIADPANATLAGSLAIPFMAKGVSVSGTIAVVAGDPNGVEDQAAARRVRTHDVSQTGGVVIVNVQVPSAPVQLGDTSVTGEPKDVVARGTLAYVAAYEGGLQIVDFSDPAQPRNVSGTAQQFVARDVVLRDNTAVFAEQLFPNAIPFVDISDPVNPNFRAIVDISSLGDYAGTGIDIDRTYVYVTGELSFAGLDYGTTGTTALMIARYDVTVDEAGIAPTVRIVSPTVNDSLVAGERAAITVEALDDVGVDTVEVTFDGQSAGVVQGPFIVTGRVPAGVPSVLIGATATDFGGNTATTSVRVNIVPDPLTTARGAVKRMDTAGAQFPVSGATVQIGSHSATTDAEGRYVLAGIPTIDDIVITASATINGLPYSGTSAPAQPVRSGETIVDDIVLAPVARGIVASTPLEHATEEVDVANGLAALVGSGGLQIANLTNPFAPFIAAATPLAGSPRDVKLASGHAYIASDEAGLLVYDVSDLANPALIGTVAGSNGTRGLDLTGTTLCAAAGAGGLQLWSLANPAAPQLLGGLTLARPVREVACHGSLAAVIEEPEANQPAKVTLLDITLPQAPVVVSSLNLNGAPSAVELTGRYVFALSDQTTIVYDISNPAAPVVAGAHLASLGSTDLAASPNHIIMSGARGPDQGTNMAAAVAKFTPPEIQLTGTFFAEGNTVAVAVMEPYAVLVTRDQFNSPRLHILLYIDDRPQPVD